ncbi:MFS transporter [Actinomadura logoneensis]|uniref:MFS transporter n=1 Tax=Actinomadura logoneensis TaxID=2293572 RepID=A0A372JPB2_9ACTN|nr:MFS transporter [Actinomadura logoneensis]RFU41857.1 MFS transporter [Actinomadura logoneensis]
MNGLLPPAGPARLLALGQLANAVGEGAFYATSALFFTRVVGLSPSEVGVALTVGWGCGMLAGVPLGHLADRRGPRRTTVELALATGAALAGLMSVRSFPLFLLLVSVYACCQGGLNAARQALFAGLVEPARRTVVRAHLQSTLNAGLAVGAGLGGLALTVDTAPAYLTVFGMDAASFVIAALVLRRLPEVAPAAGTSTGGPRLVVLRDRPYAMLMLLSAVMYLNMPILSLGLPLWIVGHTHAPGSVAAVILVVNMLGVVLFQVRVSRRVDGPRGAARASRRAGTLMVAACAVFALSSFPSGAGLAVALLLAGALVQVFAEMAHSASAAELGFGLAPDGRQGQYQGFFSMAPQIARMAGPLVTTSLLIGWGAPGWLLLGGMFLLSGLAVGPVVRIAAREGRGRGAVVAGPVPAAPGMDVAVLEAAATEG